MDQVPKEKVSLTCLLPSYHELYQVHTHTRTHTHTHTHTHKSVRLYFCVLQCDSVKVHIFSMKKQTNKKTVVFGIISMSGVRFFSRDKAE